MMNINFQEFISRNGISRTDATGGEVALTKEHALRALELLKGTGTCVLGGDVYELESDGYFRPTYENWFFEKNNFNKKEQEEESLKLAHSFLSNYKEAQGKKIRYVLVTDMMIKNI